MTASPAPGKRETPRSRVLLKARLRHRGAQIDCAVVEASASGVRIRTQDALEAGEVVALIIDGHPEFPAVVTWVEAPRAGLQFIDGPSGGLRRWGERAQTLGLV